MKKDIQIPEVKDIHIAIVKEFNEVFQCEDWNAYLINEKEEDLESVIIVSHGYNEQQKTSLMRKKIDLLPARSFAKIELIQPELLGLNNEFSVTFFEGNRMMDKTFLVEANSVNEEQLGMIPVIGKPGVLAN